MEVAFADGTRAEALSCRDWVLVFSCADEGEACSLCAKMGGDAVSRVEVGDDVWEPMALDDWPWRQTLPDGTVRVTLRLARLSDDDARLAALRELAEALTDGEAAMHPRAYPEWDPWASWYEAGERLRYGGSLYRVLQGHSPQPSWTPEAAPSLYARVLAGQEGNASAGGYAEWEQPGSTNPYSAGDRVVHGGRLWESTSDGNVWEPGAVGAPWSDLGAWPADGGGE